MSAQSLLARLNLQRPICFVDLETTGTDPENDRIVEIAICRLMPDGTRETRSRRINPWVPIPEAASKVHGITNADVENEPSFKDLAPAILGFMVGCDMAGFNSNAFDFPMLYAEFQRAGVNWDYNACRFIDVGNLFKIREPRTLSAAVKFYLGWNHEDAHGAEADVVATADVFLAQISRYEDLPANLGELDRMTNYDKPRLDLSGKFTVDEDGVVVFNFGVHKGKPVSSEPKYLEWMITKAKFAPDTVAIANLLSPHK